jgi:signal transduction histidine kinase
MMLGPQNFSLVEMHSLRSIEARRRREGDVLLAALAAVTSESEHRHIVEAAITALRDALGAATVLVLDLARDTRQAVAEVPGGSGLVGGLIRLLGPAGISILRGTQTRNLIQIGALDKALKLDLPVDRLPSVLARTIMPDRSLVLVAVGQPETHFTPEDTALFKRFIPVLRQAIGVQHLNEERERLEGELRQAQRLESLGTLAGGIAHEINTPCQFVSDNLFFIKSVFDDMAKLIAEYRGPAAPCDKDTLLRVERIAQEIDLDFLLDEAPRAIEQSLQGIGQVSRIVSAVKEFSHPGGVDPAAVDINHLIQNTIALCRNHWKYAAQIELDLTQGLEPIQGYPDQLSQIVLNLVVNAADAIEERFHGTAMGRILIATAECDGAVELSISDNGTGVPEDIQGKIFDLFFTTKPPGKGTGQGLSIVHSIVTQRHQGSIRLESEPGEGTRFIIRLPKQQALPAEAVS